MQIGAVAKRIGLSVDAIRFYERNSLLSRPPRTQGGFRQYAESDVETLAFIRRVQGLGFKLREIRGLLGLRGSRLQPCAPVRRRLQEKLADVRSAPCKRDSIGMTRFSTPRAAAGRMHLHPSSGAAPCTTSFRTLKSHLPN